MSTSKHTNALIPIVASRFLEHIAFYGVRIVLVLYMGKYLNMSNEESSRTYRIFTLLTAALPLVGGLFADHLTGVRLAGIIGAGAQALGCFILCVQGVYPLYTGLLLIAVGGGLFSPAVLGQTGLLYKSKPALMDSAMTILFICVSTAAIISSTLSNFFGNYYGFHLVFLAMGILYTGVFVLQMVTNRNIEEYRTLALEQEALPETKKPNPGLLIGLYALGIVFWIVFSNVMQNVQSLMFTRNNGAYYGSGINSSLMVFSLLPLFLLIFGIILAVVWTHIKVSAFIKMGIGFLIMVIPLLLLSFIQNQSEEFIIIGSSVLVSIMAAAAEIFVSPIILSQISLQVSAKWICTLTSLYTAIGYVASSAFNQFIGSEFTGSSQQNIILLGSAGAAVIAGLVSIVIYNNKKIKAF